MRCQVTDVRATSDSIGNRIDLIAACESILNAGHVLDTLRHSPDPGAESVRVPEGQEGSESCVEP